MKKGIIFILLVIFSVSLYALPKLVHARSYGNFFGGVVSSPRAVEVVALENFGYKCAISGTTFSIYSKGGHTSFYVPFYTRTRTRYTISHVNQFVIGNHTSPNIFTCVHPSGDSKTVSLNTVTLYGASAR